METVTSNIKMFTTKQLIGLFLGIAVALVFAFIPGFPGLGTAGMRCLGIFGLGIVWWMMEVFPDYITACWLLFLMPTFGVSTLATSFSAFSSPTMWIILPALAIGTAVGKAGLLHRIVLKILSKFKVNFKSQTLGFLLAGTIINPFIPSTAAKVSIAGPFARGFSEQLGYENQTKPAAGIFSAMWMSFGAAGPFFLTGTTLCVTMLGMLPEGALSTYTWMHWLSVAWPWGIIVLIGSYLSIQMLYKPKEEQELPRDTIIKQYEQLGPMTRNEKIAAAVLIMCLVMWVTESVHGVSVALVSMLGLCILLGTKVLDKETFRGGVAWDAWVFIATNVGMASVFSQAGVTEWIGVVAKPYLEPLFGNMALLVVVSCIAIAILRYIFVSQTAMMTVYVLACVPFAQAVGMDPFIPGFIALVTINVFSTVYQSPVFYAAFSSAGDLAKYKHVQKMSYVYIVLCIIGLLCCIPMWKLFGMY